MGAINVKIKGGRELANLLRSVPLRIERKMAKKALMAGSKPIVEEAKARAPVDTSVLESSIRAYPAKGAKIRIGPSKAAWYSHFVEFGTSKMQADPFMRPALQIGAEDQIKIASKVLVQLLEREVALMRRR